MHTKSQDAGGIREAFLSMMILLLTPGIVFWYTWWGRFQYSSWLLQGVTYAAFLLILIVNYWLFGNGVRSQGIRLDNLRKSLRLVLPGTLILGVLVLCYGLWLRNWHFDQWTKIRLYLVWGFVQQYALQNILLARSKSLFRYPPAAIVTASVIFALLHLPVPELVVFSFAGALLWCWIFHRVPNLWTLGLSHCILAVLLLVSTGLGFKIGTPGFRYEAYGGGTLVAGGYFADDTPFVATLPGYDKHVPSKIRIFSPAGKFFREWNAFPEYGFSGNLAVGDLGFDSGDAIVVAPGPGPGNPGTVRIFDPEGALKGEFEVPGEYGYGAYVSVGCGRIYATPGPAPAQDERVFEYDPAGNLLREWRPKGMDLFNSVRAFPVGAAGGHGGSRSCPESIALYATPLPINPASLFLMNPDNGTVQRLATTVTTFGMNAALFRRAGGSVALITAPGPLFGYGPHVRIYDLSGKELFSRLVLPETYPCGSNVSSLDIDGDGEDEMVLGEGICRDSPSTVRIHDVSGKLLCRWNAYEELTEASTGKGE